METPVSQGGSNKIAWFVAIIVLVGVIVALNNVNKGAPDAPSDTEIDVTQEVGGEEMIKASSAGSLVTTVDADAALPYTAAFTKYAGRRVEFSSRCVATPNKAEFKDGTKVMLDNRGSMSVRVLVGDKAFEIPAYNFTFLTLTAEKLPATYSVSCGDVKGVAAITVTK